MLALGIILVIIGILGRVFASVGHITDTTVKAMGWIILNTIVAIGSWLILILGALLVFAGMMAG